MATAHPSSRGFLVKPDQLRLGAFRRSAVVVLVAAANLIGWVISRLTLFDDWAYCDQFFDGCESHMLAAPTFVALWLSMLVGAGIVFGLVFGLSKVRLVPRWFPKGIGVFLGVYFALQGFVSLPLGILSPVLLVPGYLLGPPAAALFTRPANRHLAPSPTDPTSIAG